MTETAMATQEPQEPTNFDLYVQKLERDPEMRAELEAARQRLREELEGESD